MYKLLSIKECYLFLNINYVHVYGFPFKSYILSIKRRKQK